MRILSFILSFALFLALPLAAGAKSEKIAAVVNQDAISRTDVNDRMRLIIASSGLANNPEIREKLSGQVIGSLIDEQIKLQEARRLDIAVTPEEIEEGFATIARQNNQEPEIFKELLKRGGLSLSTMERQIESQVAWGKVVQAEVRPKITVTDRDIDAALERYVANVGKTEYLLAEIFLPVENPKESADIQQLANRLVGQMRAGQAPFFRVAQEFSKAAGASNGGDLGWVQQEQLAPEVGAALAGLKKDEVSAPVRSGTGYHILYLRDSRQISAEAVPSRDEMMKVIGMQRLERGQRRYFMDLKAAAFIENRVDS